VASVAIDGARNAGLLAAQIIGVGDPDIAARLDEQRAQMVRKVLAANEELQSS
jgi:5-(carboxyamino)imidazole ribonucleotide mutase